VDCFVLLGATDSGFVGAKGEPSPFALLRLGRKRHNREHSEQVCVSSNLFKFIHTLDDNGE